MCRSCADGGRRCPRSIDPATRSAYRKRLHAAKAATGISTESVDNVISGPKPAYRVAQVTALATQISDAYAGTKEANDALTAKYGSREKALIHVGDVMRREAERRAGIDLDAEEEHFNEVTARIIADQASIDGVIEEATNRRWDGNTAALNLPEDEKRAERERVRAAFDDETREAYAILERTQADKETLEARAMTVRTKLANSYREVLSEIRALGGTDIRLDHRTDTKAVTAFTETAQVFPQDWIEQSNKLTPPIAKVTGSRAHYSRGTTTTKKKRVQVSTGRKMVHTNDVDAWCKSSSNGSVEYRPAEDDENAVGRSGADLDGYQPVRGYYFDTYTTDENSTPPGKGWKKYSANDQIGEVVWRKPSMTSEVVSTETHPEIRTNSGQRLVEGVSGTFATSTHEMTHRMEHAVPQIAVMQREFLRRRTTTPAGEREEAKNIYPDQRGARAEVGYEDNFPLHYAGKVYSSVKGHDDGHHYELLSTGSEALFAGEHGGYVGLGSPLERYSRDDEYRAFVLGVFATAGRTK